MSFLDTLKDKVEAVFDASPAGAVIKGANDMVYSWGSGWSFYTKKTLVKSGSAKNAILLEANQIIGKTISPSNVPSKFYVLGSGGYIYLFEYKNGDYEVWIASQKHTGKEATHQMIKPADQSASGSSAGYQAGGLVNQPEQKKEDPKFYESPYFLPAVAAGTLGLVGVVVFWPRKRR